MLVTVTSLGKETCAVYSRCIGQVVQLKVDSYSLHYFLLPSIQILVAVGSLMPSGVGKSSQNFNFLTLLFHPNLSPLEDHFCLLIWSLFVYSSSILHLF